MATNFAGPFDEPVLPGQAGLPPAEQALRKALGQLLGYFLANKFYQVQDTHNYFNQEAFRFRGECLVGRPARPCGWQTHTSMASDCEAIMQQHCRRHGWIPGTPGLATVGVEPAPIPTPLAERTPTADSPKDTGSPSDILLTKGPDGSQVVTVSDPLTSKLDSIMQLAQKVVATLTTPPSATASVTPTPPPNPFTIPPKELSTLPAEEALNNQITPGPVLGAPPVKDSIPTPETK